MLVLLGSCALAQEPLPVLDGSWTASLGSGQIFRGTWSAQTSRLNLNAARGSWTVLNEAGEIVMEGTWSAQKAGQGWQGTWTARAHRGAALSGTWNADLASFSGKTIHAMLERTAEREVAGSWRTRGYQGDGLTRMVTDTELTKALLEAADAQTAADHLVSLANSHGGEDNVSVIVVHVTELT